MNNISMYQYWEDRNFVAEINNRYQEYKSISAKLISLEEVDKSAGKTA